MRREANVGEEKGGGERELADVALLFLKIERRNAGRLVSLEAGKDKEMDSPKSLE